MPPPALPNIVTEIRTQLRRQPIKVKTVLIALNYIKSLNIEEDDNINMMINGPEGHPGLTNIATDLWKDQYGREAVETMCNIRDNRAPDYNALLNDIIYEYNNKNEESLALCGVHVAHLFDILTNRLEATEVDE